MERNFAVIFSLFFICLSTFFHLSSCKPDCAANVVCPPPLHCSPPKTSVILPNPENECCNITECICEGTNSRMSSSGTNEHRYKKFSERYTNCTLVEGNLEITHMMEDAAKNILSVDAAKHVRSVTGYVLIAKNSVRHIDLSSLRLIHGRTLFDIDRSTEETCKFVKPDESRGHALYILSNQEDFPNQDSLNPDKGLEYVNLHRLTEISKGGVYISNNKKLCYIDTIEWEREILLDEATQSVDIQRPPPACPKCPASCITPEVDNVSRCWGPEDEMCQQYTKMACGETCPGRRCMSHGIRACCDGMCKGGCAKTMCYFCKDLSNFGICETTCPNSEVKDSSGTVTSYNKEKERFRLSEYCVKECPDNLRLLDNSRTCVAVCPENYHEVGGLCVPCVDDECAHICYGLDSSLGDLKQYDIIHSGNIGNFSKNCTIIKGSLNFRKATFEGDSHCNISGMSVDMLDVFANVEVITGYLSIEYWPLEDLCVFKNLKKIEGLQKRYDNQYSLIVITSEDMLRELCLNSLEEISSGSVLISKNELLCNYDINWIKFFPPVTDWTVNQNRDKDLCRPCHRNCEQSDGCWGPRSDQCVTCKNYTDYTDANGNFAGEWVVDAATKETVPGHNVTTCVKKCRRKKGVYTTEDNECYPCDEQCDSSCSGPGPSNCTAFGSLYSHGCKNVYFNGVCQKECPTKHYTNGSKVCLKCSAGCVDGNCTGPENKYGTNGCTECYRVYDLESKLLNYHGPACQMCRKNLPDEGCSKGCTYNNVTMEYECLNEELHALVWILPMVIVIILLSVIAVIYFKCRTTIKSLRKHIGQKFVDEDRIVTDDFSSPITPSGTAPNTAKLKLVKESDLTLGKELGSGAFGSVYKAVWSLDYEGHPLKIPVAVKQLKTFSNTDEILEEAHVMASVNNRYVIRLLGMCISEKLSLITQLMPLGSLLEYVRGNMDSIGSRHMLTWCMQIAKGMQYLEEKHLVHRDLAARNVLVKTPHHVKITDFGLSKMLNASQSVYFAEGGKLPIKWLAIECITERKFSHQSDVWAFGVTCWEIFTFGTRPYDGVRAVDVVSLLEKGDRLMQPSICTLDVYMVMVKCWLVDPLSRPRFSELVEAFQQMSSDYSRYLVIKDDNTTDLLSPNPEDEKQFFERLIQEDTMGIGEQLAFEEPDTYLLRPATSDQPEYENQPRIPQNTSNGSNGGPSHEMRLFSRNTPSAQLPTPQSTNVSFARSTSRLRGSDSSSPDDVFTNSGHSLPGRKPPFAVDMPIPEKPMNSQVRFNNPSSSVWIGQNRKDSEESSRYTEDPTTHNRNSYVDPAVTANDNRGVRSSEHSDGLVYDEEDYLLPTPSKREKRNDFFNAKKNIPPKLSEESPDVGMAISNNVYMDSNEMAESQETHPSSWSNQFLSQDNASNEDPLYVNDSVPDHDYLNWDARDDDGEKVPLNPKPKVNGSEGSPKIPKISDQADVEYLNPHNVVHDDDGTFYYPDSNEQLNHQLNAADDQARNHNSSLSILANGSVGFTPKGKINTNGCDPRLNPLVGRENGGVHDASSNIITGMDNPEYMMLQGQNSENDALLNEDTSEA